MTMIETIHRVIPAKRLPLLITASSASVLAAAYIFEFGFGYEPCQLCLYQRLPWFLALLVGSYAMLQMKKRAVFSILLSVLALITIAAGAGVAGYHAGVEYKFWPGPAGCSGAGSLGGGLAQAIEEVNSGRRLPACDETPWALFGISMAGYNFLISLALVAIGALVARRALTGK